MKKILFLMLLSLPAFATYKTYPSRNLTTNDAVATTVFHETVLTTGLYTFECKAVSGVNGTEAHGAFRKMALVYPTLSGAAIASTQTTVMATTTDSMLAAFVAAGDQIQVRLTGKASTKILWTCDFWKE